MALREKLRYWAKQIKRDGLTLWFAAKHPRTPWLAKFLGIFVVAYALSPIDLIPDFVPVLGYLDDVILLPGLIWITVRLLPKGVLDECRSDAEVWMQSQGERPSSKLGLALVIGVWAVVVLAASYLLFGYVERGRL